MKKHNGEKERRFLLAVKITFDGFIDMIKAYSLAAEEKAEKTENEKNKKNLRLISEDLKFLIDNPPKTFRQALQLMFMTHTAFSYEGKSAMAFGRIDQYLYSYFKKDVESGILTEQETAELLTSVFLKIYENRYFSRKNHKKKQSENVSKMYATNGENRMLTLRFIKMII